MVGGSFRNTHLEQGIDGEPAWLRHGEELCRLCKDPDHRGNRCYKAFRLSDAGKAWAKAVASGRKLGTHPNHVLLTVADVATCMECFIDESLVHDGIDALGLQYDSAATELFALAEADLTHA